VPKIKIKIIYKKKNKNEKELDYYIKNVKKKIRYHQIHKKNKNELDYSGKFLKPLL
jgi:hypothetical protein